MPDHTPGTPSLMRAINDRAALRLMLEHGPLTRPELGRLAGLSKPTASQLLVRLREAGLVISDGLREGSPGRVAEVYRINPAAAYVAALDVRRARLRVAVADITGTVVGQSELATPGRSGGDIPGKVRSALEKAAHGIGTLDRIRQTVIAVPGALNPRTGRIGYAHHLPGWQARGLVESVEKELGAPLTVENDVNLAAVAEVAHGQQGDFVLLWVAAGIGMAVMLGGTLHRGATGGAGEVGYMPVAGAPVIRDPGRANTGGLQSIAGGRAVIDLLRSHGFHGTRADQIVARARTTIESAGTGAAKGRAAFGELGGRLAAGLAATVTVLDPELIVLTGDVLQAGGEPLREATERELHSMTIPHPRVRLSTLGPNPVLTGALHLALTQARDQLFWAPDKKP